MCEGLPDSMLSRRTRVRAWMRTLGMRNAVVLGRAFPDEQVEDWQKVAGDVRLRKTLILEAAHDLQEGLRELDPNLLKLHLFELAKGTSEVAEPASNDAETTGPPRPRPTAHHANALHPIEANTLVMAAADVFVEKAQLALTKRGWTLAWLGATVAVLAAALLFGAALYMMGFADIEQALHLRRLDMSTHPSQVLTLLILRSLTISALYLGGIYFLVMIARALLHEAMVLFGRRHSLRFGRLYVYSKLGHVDFEEMQRAFGWSAPLMTAFADIRGEKISKSLVQAISEVAKEVAKSTAAAVADAARSKGGRNV